MPEMTAIKTRNDSKQCQKWQPSRQEITANNAKNDSHQDKKWQQTMQNMTAMQRQLSLTLTLVSYSRLMPLLMVSVSNPRLIIQSEAPCVPHQIFLKWVKLSLISQISQVTSRIQPGLDNPGIRRNLWSPKLKYHLKLNITKSKMSLKQFFFTKTEK